MSLDVTGTTTTCERLVTGAPVCPFDRRIGGPVIDSLAEGVVERRVVGFCRVHWWLRILVVYGELMSRVKVFSTVQIRCVSMRRTIRMVRRGRSCPCQRPAARTLFRPLWPCSALIASCFQRPWSLAQGPQHSECKAHCIHQSTAGTHRMIALVVDSLETRRDLRPCGDAVSRDTIQAESFRPGPMNSGVGGGLHSRKAAEQNGASR